jgi:hypothetical protein
MEESLSFSLAVQLARAKKRHRQAAKLVEKWKLRLAELDSAGVAAGQPGCGPKSIPIKGRQTLVPSDHARHLEHQSRFFLHR